MKRGFLTLAVVMTAAGVASAFAFAPADPLARVPARELPMRVDAKPAAAVPVTATAAPAPAIKKASIEVKQAPVPLLVKPRPAIEQQPTVNGERPIADAPAPGPELSAKASDPVVGSAAKAAIEADGYKGVTVLRQGANGLWYAKAMRGKTEVLLTVNASGHVALE